MNSTVVIAVGIIIIMALIVWAFVASAAKETKKKKLALAEQLDQLAIAYDTTIGPSDFMGKKVIAQDVKKGKIFYVDHTVATPHAEVIDIAQVVDCTVVQAGNRHVESGKNGKVKTEEHINKILLEVNMRTGKKLSLLFYDEANDGVQDMMLLKEKAEKWKGVIKN